MLFLHVFQEREEQYAQEVYGQSVSTYSISVNHTFKVTVWRILQYLVIKRIDMSKLGCLSNSDTNNISIKGVNLMKKTYHLVNTVVFSDCTVIESDGGTN